MVSPNRKDFWRLPVYRSLIPRLMEKPDLNLCYLQKEKVWIVGDKRIVVKEVSMGRIAELITRIFRELHFLLNRSYRVKFFKAKDRIERTYEDSLRHEKTVRWVVEEKIEKFPEREKMASQQLLHRKKIVRSGKQTQDKVRKEFTQKLAPLQEKLKGLNQQKCLWDSLQDSDDRSEEAIEKLNEILPVLVSDLTRGDCIRIYNALKTSIQTCEEEIKRVNQYYQNALQQLEGDIEIEQVKENDIDLIVKKIPESPFKHRPVNQILPQDKVERVARRLFDDPN